MHKRIYISFLLFPPGLFFLFYFVNMANTFFTADKSKIINVAVTVGVLNIITGIIMLGFGYLLLSKYKDIFSASCSTEDFNARFRSKFNVHMYFNMYYSLAIYSLAPFLYFIAQLSQGYGSVVDRGIVAHNTISSLGLGVILATLNFLFYKKWIIKLGELQGFKPPNLLLKYRIVLPILNIIIILIVVISAYSLSALRNSYMPVRIEKRLEYIKHQILQLKY